MGSLCDCSQGTTLTERKFTLLIVQNLNAKVEVKFATVRVLCAL